MTKKFWLAIFCWICVLPLCAAPSRGYFVNYTDQFLSEQKVYLAAAGLTSSPPTGYVPFTVINNSGTADSSVYILILTNTDTNIITFAPNHDGLYLGSLATPPPSTYVSALGSGSYPLSYFPTDPVNGGHIFYLPSTVDLTSSRIYYSVGQPIDWFIPSSGPVGVQPLDFETPTQDNYYTLFDKQEFTMVANNRFAMNPTLVDYYGLPLSFSIKYIDYTQSGLPTVTSYAGLPPTLKSSSIFSSYSTATNTLATSPNGGVQPKWSSLYLTYAPPSGSSSSLRVLSPNRASQTAVPLFPLDYFLTPNYISCSWLSNVWYNAGTPAYFQTHTLYVDLSTAGPTYGYASGTVDGSGNFNFTAITGTGAGSTLTLPLPTTSKPFFTSALADYTPAPTQTGDANVATAIWQGFSAGVISGIVPLSTTSTTPLSQSFIRTQTLFANNSLISCNGPWYDFYSGTFIALGSGNYTKFYTTPYGDYLGLDGTITVTNITNAGAHVIATIGDMSGIAIPNPFNDNNNYTVAFGALPVTATATFGTNPDYTSNPSIPAGGQTYTPVAGSTMYLQVTYTQGSYKGSWGTHIIPSAPALKPILPIPVTMSLVGGAGGTLNISIGGP